VTAPAQSGLSRILDAVLGPAAFSRPSRASTLGVLALGVVLAALGARSWYVCDDAYISFRYVRNVVEGYGLRWNLEDPPVEGFSNPVWLALSIALRSVGLDEVRTMPAVSIGIAVCVLLAVARWVRHEHPHAQGAPVAAAALLALSSGFSNWSTSGLETMQAAATLLAAVLAWTYEGPWWLRGGLGVLLVASRPEGIAWAFVCVGIGALRQPRSWGRLGLAAVLVVTGAELLLLTRYAIFGEWVPNTALAKSGHDVGYYLRGLRYVLMNGIVLALPIPAAAVAAWRGVRWLASHRAAASRMVREDAPTAVAAPFPRPLSPHDVAALVVLGHVAFAVAVGGDYMPFGRFLLGSLPFAAFLLAGVVAELDRGPRRLALAGLGVVALVSGLPQFDVPLSDARMREVLDFRNSNNFKPTEREMWWAEKSRPIAWKKDGQYLRRFLGPDERYMVVAIGASGYYSHRYLYDVCYLVQPLPKGTVLAVGKGPPGHDSCVMRKTLAELASNRITKSVGFTEVPSQGQVGDVWSERLPDRAVRTYYRARLVDPAEKPETFFYIDRYDPDDLPEDPS
jgi:hypothetical protein